MTKKNNKDIKKVHTKLDVHTKMVVNIILICLLLVGSAFMFVASTSINVKESDEIISYQETSSVEYKVSLLNNSYYDNSTLGMNMQYPSSLIDKITIDFKYNLDMSEVGDYTYRYFTTATIIAANKNDSDEDTNLVYSRSYNLENEVSDSVSSSNNYFVNKTYTIDYQTYNTLITNYKTEYNLSLDAYLKVVMYVEVIDNYNDTTIDVVKNMEVDIPLLDNPVSIAVNNPEDVNKSITLDDSKTTINIYLLITAIIMLITGIMLFIQEGMSVVKSEKEQSKFLHKINKIISSNSDVIIKSKNKIDLSNVKIIDVEKIEELLDAQSELRIPITYYETKKNKEGYFVIMSGEVAYRYTFKVK